MPKSKKKKHQDFQKVKLKVGKRLPKGDNVTNLSFKTRQIQLTQRIKEDEGQGHFTKKKENVQDLLRQCDHHSSSSRLSAVMGLRELWLGNYEEMMVPTNVHGYSTILKKISSLFIDNEATVRHAVVNLFKVILHKLARDSTVHLDRLLGGSLFAYLHTFLCCAMNHVHEDVRLDSLLLYDVLLETCPSLVVQQTGGLLRNLVGLLAAPISVQVGSRDATTQKLSLNPESRLPVKLFRVKVLSRIKQTLMAALNDKQDLQTQTKSVENQPVWSLYNDHSDRKKKQNTAIMSRQTLNRFQTMLNGGSHDLDDYITNPTSLQSFMDQCVPVMIQCWVEARADNETQNESASLLTCDAMEVVSLVVSVIQLLFVLTSQSKRRQRVLETSSLSLRSLERTGKTLMTSLERLMMPGFPYSEQLEAVSRKKKAKKKSGIKSQQEMPTKGSLSSLNLGICDIMTTFCSDTDVNLSKIWLKKISRHVVLSMRESPNTEQYRVMIRIIKNVFFNPSSCGHLTKVYKAALQCYKAASPKSEEKKMFYEMLAEMGQTWDGWSETRNDMESKPVFCYKENQDLEVILVEFFQSLSQLALAAHSQGDEQWTLSILRLMRHGHVQLYCKPFADNLTQVLDPDQGLFASSTENIQQNVCALFATGTPFTKENLRQLLHLIRCPTENPIILNRRSSSCISHILCAMFANIRACVPLTSQLEVKQMNSNQHQLLSDYLRFLFSLQIGFTGEELNKLCPIVTSDEHKTCWFDIILSVSEPQWRRHVEIADVVAREITSFHLAAEPDLGFKHAFSFLDNFEHFWTQTFGNRQKIHVLSVLGLTKQLVSASQPTVRGKLGQKLQSFTSTWLAAVLSNMYDQEVVSVIASDLVWQIKADLTHCLAKIVDSALLENVMELLKKREKGDFGGSESERQAAKSAQNFLLTDEILRHKLSRDT